MNWLDDDFSEDRDTESARFRDDGHDHGTEYMRPAGGVAANHIPEAGKMVNMDKWQFEEEQRCVCMAKRAVVSGNAGCWKTVAGFLYDEILRLEEIITRTQETT